MKPNCMECGHSLTVTGITYRDETTSYHCENCHLDQTYVKDPYGSDFWDKREQHDDSDCSVCADGGPKQPRA